jgi:hypothetical protein
MVRGRQRWSYYISDRRGRGFDARRVFRKYRLSQPPRIPQGDPDLTRRHVATACLHLVLLLSDATVCETTLPIRNQCQLKRYTQQQQQQQQQQQ